MLLRGVAFVFVSVSSLIVSASAWGQADDRYTFRATHEHGLVGTPVEVGIYYDGQIGSSGLAPLPLTAWSYGLCHDEAVLDLQMVEDGAVSAFLNPDFNTVNEYPGGYVIGVVVDFFGVDVLAPDLDQHLNQVTYMILPTAEPTTEIAFCESLGFPIFEVLVVADGVSVPPVAMSGSVTLTPEFIRGECNNDGSPNLPDVVFLLGYLFPPSGTPPTLSCREACDANNDGTLSLPDAIVMLTALFGTPPTSLPEPTTCGPDPVQSNTVDCAQFDACP